jgi:hypothetical protein
MNRNRTTTVLFIGILICVPMLALYHFGVFPQAAQWLAERLPRYLVLPAAGIQISLPLQYSFYTLAAFTSAWLGLELPAIWQKYLYLLTLSFLICLLTPLLALNGVLFEPFSATLAASFAGLLGVMLSDPTFRADDVAASLVSEPVASVASAEKGSDVSVSKNDDGSPKHS